MTFDAADEREINDLAKPERGEGWTDWAARLAERAPMEIVSMDSALVYRGLDIGTAKPPKALRQRIPHHLIDICDPAESYSAGRFVAKLRRKFRRLLVAT